MWRGKQGGKDAAGDVIAMIVRGRQDVFTDHQQGSVGDERVAIER